MRKLQRAAPGKITVLFGSTTKDLGVFIYSYLHIYEKGKKQRNIRIKLNTLFR